MTDLTVQPFALKSLKAQLRNWHAAGHTPEEMASGLNVSLTTVRTKLREMGLYKPNLDHGRADRQARIRKFHPKARNLSDLVRLLSSQSEVVRRDLAEMGLPLPGQS